MPLPSTPMFDDFHRPDESPLSNQGRWGAVDTAFNPLTISSNRCVTAGGASARYWSASTGIGASECWLTAAVDSTTAAVFLRLNGTGGTNTWDGYVFTVSSPNTVIDKYTNNVLQINLTAVPSVSLLSAGEVLLAQAFGSELTVYRKLAGGQMRAVARASDTTYPTGAVGIYLEDATSKLASCGGGTINSLYAPSALKSGRYHW